MNYMRLKDIEGEYYETKSPLLDNKKMRFLHFLVKILDFREACDDIKCQQF